MTIVVEFKKLAISSHASEQVSYLGGLQSYLDTGMLFKSGIISSICHSGYDQAVRTA